VTQTQKQFLFHLSDIVAAVQKDGVLVSTLLQDRFPGEHGPHPITRRDAWTYYATEVFISETLEGDRQEQARIAAFDQYKINDDEAMAAASAEAYSRVHDQLMARLTRQLAYSGPGQSSGPPITLPSREQNRIHEEATAAGDEAAAAYRKSHPRLDRVAFEKRH